MNSELKQRYLFARQFYSELSPDLAIQALEASANMREYLGKYYETLTKELKKRKSKKGERNL